MADFTSHRSQAIHNEAAARAMLPAFHDWAVTATFYAALHYYECWLFSRPNKTAEFAALPQNPSPHSVRMNYIQKYMASGYKSYSFLYQRSRMVRYLAGIVPANPSCAAPALLLVDAAQAKHCLDNRLPEFKIAIRADLCDLLYSLKLSPTAFQAVLSQYPNVKAFESESSTREKIQSKLSPTVAGELITALIAAGKKL